LKSLHFALRSSQTRAYYFWGDDDRSKAMRKLLLIGAALAIVTLVESPTMQANAEVVRGMSTIKTATQNFTPIQKAACFGWGKCAPGFHEVCGPRRCWCARC
jgi:hypothetical protein